MMRSADISQDTKYRYRLTRSWGPGRSFITWIMLNPSTADADVDDPTIRRCIGFTKAWGFDGLAVVNLYAYRATDPRELDRLADAVGPLNDEVLRDAIAGDSAMVVCAWGTRGRPDRVREVLRHAAASDRRLYCVGTTASGSPRHPLYVRGDTAPMPFEDRLPAPGPGEPVLRPLTLDGGSDVDPFDDGTE